MSDTPSPEHTEISIWLDSYDDLFSDFDPRPYAQRTLSDDFLVQAKKLTRDQDGRKIMYKLLMPEAIRNKQDEATIIKCLHDHFQKGSEQLLSEKKRAQLRGLQLTVAGVALMMAAGYLSLQKEEKYYLHVIFIILEPAGWFLLWMGLDTLVYYSRKTMKELDFYEKAAKARIEFGTY